MESLLTSMSFWGIAAVVATTSQLVWEYIRSKSQQQAAKVTALSQRSLSLFNAHYKLLTIAVFCGLILFALNTWVIARTVSLIWPALLTGSLVYAFISFTGEAIDRLRQLYPHSKYTAMLEGKQPVNFVTVIAGIGGMLFLFAYYQSTLIWTPYVVLYLFAAYVLGATVLSLMAQLLAALAGNQQIAPARTNHVMLLGTERMDTLSGAVIATALLGTVFLDLQAFHEHFHGLGGILLPMLIAVSGVAVSAGSAFASKLITHNRIRPTSFLEKLLVTAGTIALAYLWVKICLPETWVIENREYEAMQVFYAAQAGLLCGLVISKLVRLYHLLEKVFMEYLYLKSFHISAVDKAVHAGFRAFSAIVPLVLLIAAFLLAYKLVGLYGVFIAVVAMQSNLRTELSAEMAELEKLVLRSKKIFFHAQ